MNAREYQEKAHAFASYGENEMYPALGLAEEAGEVCRDWPVECKEAK